MKRPSVTAVRIALALVLLVSVGSLVGSYAAAQDAGVPTGGESIIRMEERIDNGTVDQSGAAADNVTVVATQGFYISDEEAELVAFSAAGEVVYYNDSYRAYYDVDPVPGERYTVEYVAAKHLGGSVCEETDRCTRNVVERVNLTTGETTRVYGKVTPRIYSARWHDVDRVNDTHLAVADIVNDRVYVVDTRTDEITWQWRASEDFSRDSGGKKGDWTHVNDVEVLADGRIMASLRNQDQVVFLEPGTGLNESWTLGSDGDHGTLYEQHNPDYIPADRGGPAILVGDSENNRVVEYHRVNGSWERVWQWRDARTQWPRDADRLPNGHTLVVDSHGDRVLELDREGDAVWNVSIGMAYDAERLGTGDESAGGPARATAVDADAWKADLGPVARVVLFVKGLLPSVVVNGLLYVSPSWVRFADLLVAFGGLLTGVTWGALEFRWSSLSLRGLGRRVGSAVRSMR